MNPKSLGIAGLMALSALALIAVIASNPFTSQASTHVSADLQQPIEQPSTEASTTETTNQQQVDLLQGTEEETDDSDPYIGIQITELDDGSVKVLRVVAGGPSDGLLMQGDVITAVNGTTIESASDLVDAITEAGSGTEIALTVTRDGASITVDVTVGDRETRKALLTASRNTKFHSMPRFGFPRSGKTRWSSVNASSGTVVRSEVVLEKQDGTFSTHRRVIGTVSDVDSSAGTFTLTPKDGSDAIDYTVTDDTKVVMNRSGDLGPLNTEDDTLVVDVDGEVRTVIQGYWPNMRAHFSRGGKRFGIRHGGAGTGRGNFSERNLFLDRVNDEMRARFGNRS